VRFAAKVAARRALGLPLGGFREVEVVRERGRPPRLALGGASGEAARALGADRSLLTLTHDASWCISQVIFETEGAR
jgi:phosphopantetheinyl transferase (holo-ACP synthase)